MFNLNWLYLVPAVFLFHTILTLWFFIVIEKWIHNGVTKENATTWEKVYFWVGMIMDVSYNYSPLGGSLALMQFPRYGEVTFTAHVKRIKKAALPGYRYNVARSYCFILQLFDSQHCQ